MDKLKGALRSKTVWFNLISGALEISNLFVGIVPPGTLTAVNVVGNVALRFITNEPLAAKVNPRFDPRIG